MPASLPLTDRALLREHFGLRLERARLEGEPVFVKTLIGATPARAARFEREGRIAAGLRHPNIVPLTAQAPGQLAYRWVEGESLRDRLERGPLTTAEAIDVTRALLEALEYAHTRGVLHLDLKPENVLLSGSSVYLTDFGQAHARNLTRLTGPGERLGTPQYMAPEQFHGGRTDPRSDLYATSALLFEGLTGELPHPDSLAWLMGRGPDPDLRPAPEVFRALLQAGLDRDPNRRPASARAYLRALDALRVSA